MSLTEVQARPTASLSGYGPVKRLFDIVTAVSILIPLLPLLLLIAVAVKLETRGPALFRQARCGAGSRPFMALKFRTMHVDAEARLAEMLAADADLRLEYQRHHKLRNDPRVTLLGRILRRTSLDELPQLWNVLAGDMSLIGPRPYMPHELAPHPSARSAIARVKPGITGLWQVSGRHRTTFEDRLGFDIAYVERYSLRQDIVILLRTVMVVLKADGI
jgi:lipopolysaccharide/colanic/teichoic acid biosynthesis glycosyltransferase